MPSPFRFSAPASHRCGSEPIGWSAGISSRKVDGGFRPAWWQLRVFPWSSRLPVCGCGLTVGVPEAFPCRASFISNMASGIGLLPCFHCLFSFFNRATTFGGCSLLGRVFAPVALVAVPVVGRIAGTCVLTACSHVGMSAKSRLCERFQYSNLVGLVKLWSKTKRFQACRTTNQPVRKVKSMVCNVAFRLHSRICIQTIRPCPRI